MLSRKQIFKDLLFKGIRAVNDLAGEDEKRPKEHEPPVDSFDLSATELSPSLLAIEAERRGLDLGATAQRSCGGRFIGSWPKTAPSLGRMYPDNCL